MLDNIDISIIDTLEKDEQQTNEQDMETMKRVEKIIHDYKGHIKSRLNLEQREKHLA